MTHPKQRRDDEGEPRPWDVPGGVRRNCVAHRGRLLGALGDVCVVCGVLSFLLVAPGLVALALAVFVSTLGRRDLEEMRRGRMDPRGAAKAEDALDSARWGAGLALGSWAFYAAVIIALALLKKGLGE